MIMTPDQVRACINEQAMSKDLPPLQPGALAEHIIREIEDTPDLSAEALGILMGVAAILMRSHHEAVAEQAAAEVLRACRST